MDQFVWWMLLGSLLVLMVAALSVIFCCANTLRGKKKKKKKEGEKRDCEGAGWKRWTVFHCNFSPPKLSLSDEVKTGTEQQQEVSSIQRLGRESKATLVSRQTCNRCLMMLCNTRNRHLRFLRRVSQFV